VQFLQFFALSCGVLSLYKLETVIVIHLKGGDRGPETLLEYYLSMILDELTGNHEPWKALVTIAGLS
jgi:hypothetical protein